MRSLIYFCGIIALTLAGPVSHQEDNLDEVTAINDTNVMASENDVTYFLYDRRNTQGLLTRLSDVSNTQHIRRVFESNRPTLVLIHGWVGDNNADSNTFIRNVVLNHFNVNVIVVNWGRLAGLNYAAAQRNVVPVGQLVARFLRTLSQLYNHPLSSVTITGFSLGAHVSGVAGANLNRQIGQIVGLDPAGPLFNVNNRDNLLDSGDARYVTIIHTNGGRLGIGRSTGHSDFYPNGGSTQPGCGVDLAGSCAHARAWEFYAESLVNNRFVSQNCNSYRDFSNGRCTGRRALLGGFNLDRAALGDFFLDTNNRSPFGRG